MASRSEKPIADSYWVLSGRLLAGEYPGAKTPAKARPKVLRFLEAGVTCFVDLTEEGELEPYHSILAQEASRRGLGVIHRRMGIVDGQTPSHTEMVDILNTIDHAIEGGWVVYVHCWGGIGRTGTVVGCFLVRHGLEPAPALAEIKRLRWGNPDGYKASPETLAQKEFVMNWRAGT